VINGRNKMAKKKFDDLMEDAYSSENKIVVDCFTFYNELDMLEFRLTELDEIVDIFIIVEATKTHSGKEKELNFQKNKKRFSKWLHKIYYYVVDDLPLGQDSSHDWFREEYQRDAIKKPLSHLSLKPKDIIILSDLDEIPDTDTIAEFKRTSVPHGAVGLCMDWYYYNLTTRLNAKHDPIKSTKCKVFHYQSMFSEMLSMTNIRHAEWFAILEGGWHLSFFMTPEKIIEKLESYAHQEFNTDEIKDPEKIRRLITEGKDLFPEREESNYFYQLPVKDNDYLPKKYKFWLEKSRVL
tara:strand:- start:5080 stop:5964 length:885 start_codon:yes stop_codon:yes gene_type:complete